MVILIIIIIVVGYFIVRAINNNSETNVRIANAKAEADYYNSLSDEQKLTYEHQKSMASQQKMQRDLIKSKVKLYQYIYKIKFGGEFTKGKSDDQIAENQKVQLLASTANVRIDSGKDVREIMLSPEFLSANFLTASLKDMINKGLDDKKISKKFARKNERNGVINNSSKWSNTKSIYKPEEIAQLRQYI